MENLSMLDIEYKLQNLRSLGIFGTNEQAALASACHIVAELRLVLGYNPSDTTLHDLSNLIRKEVTQ